MKKIFEIFLATLLIFFVSSENVVADSFLPGYSEWSEEASGNKNEVSDVQYGRLLPKTWSPWSTTIPESKFQKSRVGNVKHYSYNGESHYWNDANAKELFTWDFGSKVRITFLYADVDTYVSSTWTNYQGPPLQLYCDGTLVKNIGAHDYSKNWNPDIDCNCRYLKLSMGANAGLGRNRTSIVGTWATVTTTEYSYVVEWDNGNDWRFDEQYEELYGEDSQIPTQRDVYSYPLTYSISYDLDGGEPLGDLVYEYTVLDEVILPAAYKKGYNFIGWFDQYGKQYEKIPSGTYGDLLLIANYERKEPTIYISDTYYEQDDRRVTIEELLKDVNAKAIDELDGDISDKITVDYINYNDSGILVNNPEYLDISEGQKVNIGFSITNSGDKKAFIEKTIYILAKHEISEYDLNNTKIYTRFINDNYKETLATNSVWLNENYQRLLNTVYEKMRKED